MRFNIFQWGVIHGLAWVVCLADGWVIHNHVLFGVGLFFLFYSLWRMTMKTPEDEEFERIEAEGWRKRQIALDQKAENARELGLDYAWVGLTDEEREEIALEVPMDAIRITEAKLKEKNT
jgi:hypothetical protein